MRYVLKFLAVICLLILVAYMLLRNLTSIIHNLFCRTKRRICWDPMADCQQYGDYETGEIHHL